jgi:4-diphosphocytidyl-2-C-methyl-D-erythritol kinase
MTVHRTAPAKLNLFLHVLGRRPDGYHLLDSLIAFADIADAVSAAPSPRLSLAIEGPFAADLAGDPAGNLVWRAAVRLAERLGRPPQAALTLVKNLPVASGIGGGSSDAAATLRALGELWGEPLDETSLRELAVTLGADVPACLGARPVWLGGVGERLDPAPALPRLPLVLVNPGVALPTAAVFRARRGGFAAPAARDLPTGDRAAFVAWLARQRNDLTEAASGLVPEIAEALAILAAAPGTLLARMSGSGATCFALFADAAAANTAAEAVRRPGWWVAAGRLL